MGDAAVLDHGAEDPACRTMRTRASGPSSVFRPGSGAQNHDVVGLHSARAEQMRWLLSLDVKTQIEALSRTRPLLRSLRERPWASADPAYGRPISWPSSSGWLAPTGSASCT